MAFGFYSAYNVQSGQVPSTQTDFPVLVNVTDARFKTTGNGGHVQNSSGFDIRPYTNSGLGTAITGYELERYNASTGEVVMWVKVSSLSSSTTPFVLAYGNSGISTDGSSTTTWDSNFKGVYHLGNGSSLSAADATNQSNGTIQGTVTAGVGQIDGAATGFDGNFNERIDIGGAVGGSLFFTGAMTVSGWAKITDLTVNRTISGKTSTTPNRAWTLVIGSTGAGSFLVASNNSTLIGVTSSAADFVTNTWYYVAGVYNPSTSITIYKNGAQLAQNTTSIPASQFVANSLQVRIGGRGDSTDPFQGSIDEIRISNVVRSADWLSTEYNNQFAPGTFATLGTEQVPSGGSVNSGFMMFM